ncbi:MAG: GNAT family N-acetyltransferase [Alphaproteobacteria bacterium]|nr:GNAT family N-acetyltransferase [Alphaproteobacteria bacterium]
MVAVRAVTDTVDMVVPIVTARLLLRPVGEDDREAFVTLLGTPEVMAIRKLGVLDRQAANVVFDGMRMHWRDYGFGMYSVRGLESGAFLGECGLRYLEDGVDVELSYGLVADARGRGLATEAVRAVVEHGLHDLNLPRIVAFARADNTASRHILEKFGMTLVGEFAEPPHTVVKYRLES